MSTQVDENLERNSLKIHWDLIDNSRAAMAKEISTLAGSLSGPRARQLKSVSRWLKGSQGYESILTRPDVLCFCQAWVEAVLNKPDQATLNEFERAGAIGVGFCTFENNAPLPRDMTPFLYPAISFLAWLLIVIFGSVFLLPQFRTLFEEFGIELPLTTQWILKIGMWVEANWFSLLAVVILLPLTLTLLLWFSQRGSAYSLSWVDRQFSRFRTKLSVWATHVASLLSAGVNEMEAIQLAGRCSSSTMLRERCDDYVKDRNQDLLDPTIFPLVNNSLLLSNKAAKIRVLEETARYYQSLSRVVQSWWLTWLSKAILVLIVVTTFIAIFSIFAPLMSIITGLTGGGFF